MFLANDLIHTMNQQQNNRPSAAQPQNVTFDAKQRTSELVSQDIRKKVAVAQRIVGHYRMQKLQKMYLQRRKHYRYRKHVISEIIDTEIKYVQDLQTVRTIVLSRTTYSIASNLDEIIQCNQEMLSALLKYVESENNIFLQNYNFQPQGYGRCYSTIFKVMMDYLKHFKCYYQYCVDFDRLAKYRDELRKSDPSFQQLVADAEKSSEFRSLDLEGFLVKPVQRLPKYILLIKDLKKHTPEDHPDYKNIAECLVQFEQINDINNQKLDQAIKSQQKIDELQKMLGHKMKLDLSGKLFLFEESLTLYRQPSTEKPIILYCFNDFMILVGKTLTENSCKYTLLSHIAFNQKTQCTKIPDNAYYKHLFKISGSNKIYLLIASSEEDRDKVITKIQNAINSFREQKLNAASEQLPQVQVTVDGTEEYNIASISRHTVYVISVRLEHLSWQIHMRYSEIEQLYFYVRSHTKIKLNELVRVNIFKNHSNKELELRKINIENIFQQIFDGLQQIENQGQILKKLKMPKMFFKLYHLVKDDHEQEKLRKGISLDDTQYSDQINIVDSIDAQFMEQLSMLNQITEASQTNENIEIKIHLPGGVVKAFKIGSTTTAIQLCHIIAQHLSLQKYFDYRLFVTDTKGNSRPLDNNQVVVQSVPNDPHIFEDQSSWAKTKLFLTMIFDVPYIMEFKKHLFLSQDVEQLEYRSDPVRLSLITKQIFDSTKSDSMNHYSFEHEALIYSLYLIINKSPSELDQLQQKSHGILHDLCHVIHESEIKLKPQSEWKKELIFKCFKEQYTELNKLRYRNNQVLKKNEVEGKISMEVFEQLPNLARMALINFYYATKLAGVTQFYVGVCSESIAVIQPFIHQQLPNLYIGVSYNALYFLSPGNNKIMHRVMISSIASVVPEPLNLRINILIKEQEYQFQFRTFQGYRINRLIQEYKNIASLMSFNRLEEN